MFHADMYFDWDVITPAEAKRLCSFLLSEGEYFGYNDAAPLN